MNDRIEGILLSQKDYRENSVLLTVLTKEYGKLTFVARGARKINSKNAGSLLPFVKGEFLFDYKENKTMFTLKNFKVNYLEKKFYQDILLQTYASICCEITSLSVNDAMEAWHYQDIFDALFKSLQMLGANANPSLVTSLFVSLVLSMLGIQPEVDRCVMCGKQNAAALVEQEGGFICDTCASQLMIPFESIHFLKQFRYVCKAQFENFESLEALIDQSDLILNRLLTFYEYHFGVKIHSYAFLRSLAPLNE